MPYNHQAPLPVLSIQQSTNIPLRSRCIDKLSSLMFAGRDSHTANAEHLRRQRQHIMLYMVPLTAGMLGLPLGMARLHLRHYPIFYTRIFALDFLSGNRSGETILCLQHLLKVRNSQEHPSLFTTKLLPIARRFMATFRNFTTKSPKLHL